jgi:predicted Fe-Mo cluster-binding NifX family protein
LKIAVVSENETTISQHFGRAPYYIILTVENGKTVKQEKFERGASGTCACGHSEEEGHHHASHGNDADSSAKHNRMVDPIADCQVLIAGGMGYGAYQALKSRNLQVFITAESSIQKAVELFSAGKLDNLMERLH